MAQASREGTDIMHSGPSRRSVIAGVAAVALAPVVARGAEPGRDDAAMVTDWPWLGRYAKDNARIQSEGTQIDIVFIGDSITELWKHRRPDFFSQKRINRGIGGQTSPQILLRMMADVVAHRPKFVHILAGTNDVAGNTGPIAVDATIHNLVAMVQLAKANGIRPVVGTIPPAAQFFWRPEIEPVGQIQTINQMLHKASKSFRFALVDYHGALTNADGALPPDLSVDGVHPDAAGYERMERALVDKISAFRSG